MVNALPAPAVMLLSWTPFSTELSLVLALRVKCWKSLGKRDGV